MPLPNIPGYYPWGSREGFDLQRSAQKHINKLRQLVRSSRMYTAYLPGKKESNRKDRETLLNVSLEYALSELSEYFMGHGLRADPDRLVCIDRLAEGGLATMLMETIVDFLGFDDQYKEDTVLSYRIWARAVESLGHLVIHSQNYAIQRPALREAARGMREQILPVMGALMQNGWWDLVKTHPCEFNPWVVIHATHMPSILLNPKNFGLTGEPSIEACRTCVPYFFRLRGLMTLGSAISDDPTWKYPSNVAESSARNLSTALKPLALPEAPQKPLEPGELCRMTGLSVSEMLDDTYAVEQTYAHEERLKSFPATLWEATLMSQILCADQSELSIKAYADHEVISWLLKHTVELVNIDLNEWRKKDTSRPPVSLNDAAYDVETSFYRVLMTVIAILTLAGTFGLKECGEEVLKLDVMVILEMLSSTRGRLDTDNLTNSTGLISDALDKLDPALGKRFRGDVRVVASRAGLRKDMNGTLAAVWRKTYTAVEPNHRSLPLFDHTGICAAMGCPSSRTPKMQCAACKMRWYCDKSCQLVDWKYQGHKLQCKKLKAAAASS